MIKLKFYEDIYSKIKGRETEIDLDSYILNKQDYIDIAEQLELDFLFYIRQHSIRQKA